MSAPSPAPVRVAAAVVTAQGVVALLVAATLVTRHLAGTRDQPWLSGFGTAGWFVVMGAAVLSGGVALLRGRRWGRGIAVFAQLLLLPVAWYMTVGSQRWLLGVPVGVAAIAVLGLLFSPPAVRWWADQPSPGESVDPGGSDGPDGSASAESAAPESR